MKYKNPIVNFDMTNDFSHLVVGMSDGTFSVRKNKSKQVFVKDPNANMFSCNIKCPQKPDP